MHEAFALQGVTDTELCACVPGLDRAHARKLLATVHQDRALAPRTGLPRAAIDAVLKYGHLPTLTILGERASRADPFRKYVLVTPDGQRIESVCIPLARPDRVSVCVSSQIGCGLACAFCATGQMGLRRNLETWEIVEQVRIVRRGLASNGLPARGQSAGTRVHGVVFQGMGEPLANLDRVAAAIAVLTAPYAQAIDARAITVCTAGLPEGIRRLAHLAPRVRLGLSIGSTRPDVRARIMPISRAHGLDEVLDAAAEHARATGLAPMWAITLLRDINDSDDEARALAERALAFRERTGLSPRLSVIDYNKLDHTGRDPFERSQPERIEAFRDALAAAGVHSHHRYSGGSDIAAACGQLAAEAGR